MTTMMRVLIGGTDYSAQVEGQSLNVSLPTTRKGSVARFDVLDTSLALRITPLETCTIYDVDGTTPIFSGIITRPTAVIESPGTVNRWKCQAQDPTYYMDTVIVNEVYTNMTADAIVKALITKYLPSLTTVNVQPGPLIQYIIFAHRTLRQTFRKLIKQSQVAGIIVWFVDPANDVHWGEISQVPSTGVTLSDQNADIAAGAVQYEPRTFSYDQDGTQIVNNVIIRGATAPSITFTDNFLGDGSTSIFPLSYGPSQVSGAMMPVVTVGGVVQTVAYDTGVAPTTQWIIGNQVFGSATSIPGTSFLRLGTASAPGSGVAVNCQYQYDVPTLVQLSHPGSIAKYNTPGSMTRGKHSRHVLDQTIKSNAAAISKAKSWLASYAYHIPTTKVTVPESYQGVALKPGESVQFVCGQVGYSATTVITSMTIKGTPDGRRKIDLIMEQP